jgi:hypothetical protein
MDFQILEADVYVAIRDTDKQFVTSTEVKPWINQGYLDLAARLKVLRPDSTGTVGADGDVDCPADFTEEGPEKVTVVLAGDWLS